MPRRIPLFPLFSVLLLLVLTVLGGCQKSPAVPENSADSSASAPSGSPAAANGPETEAAALPTPAPLPDLTFAVQTTAVIPTTGETMSTENGASIQIAPDALGDGVTAELSEWAIDPSWQQALEQVYTIDAPFVSLAAVGANDSQGRAVLRLPAPSPNSRLVAFIDNTYLAMLDVTPQDGFLETAVRLGPSDAGTAEQVGSLTPGGSLQYTVLTPLATAAAKGRLSKPGLADGRSCAIQHIGPNDENSAYSAINHCRKSGDGTVQVNFLSVNNSSTFSDAEADQLADAIAAALNRYGTELGFTAAQITANSPMYIVVETGSSGDPRYKSFNGVIYLPLDAAQGMIGGNGHDTLHEMAHWIQDEEYNMAWAYWSGGKTWWLETAAENMVMLHDPAYIPKNLTTYGPITTSDNRLALQQSPYQWPGDFYAHAQLVKLNMCADTAVCPLSEESFKAAINAGTYPYDNADAQSKLSANLDAYAKYLLGAAPGSGNPNMPLDGPVASGESYGEYIQIAQTTKSDYDLSFNGTAPQMQKGTDGLGETVTVAALLQKDGVYPLNVTSGFNGRNPGLPVKLTIQPGAPFWYRIGKDAPQFHDGSTELILQPIHLTLGLPGVRLVALGKTGGETFQATLSQIDLQGAWLIIPGEVVSDNIVCQDATAETADGTLTVHAQKEMPLQLPTLLSVLGDFRPDSAGGGLVWEWNDGRIPAEVAPYTKSTMQFNGIVRPGVDKVQALMGVDVSRAISQAPGQWPPLLFGVAMIIPGLWGWRRGGKRPYLGLLSLFLGIFLLAGCAGFDMWGSVFTDMQFTELTYLGGEAVPVVGGGELPAEPPIWKLKGTAVYDISFNFAGTQEGQDLVVASCTGTATYNVEAQIFKDLIVNLEQ